MTISELVKHLEKVQAVVGDVSVVVNDAAGERAAIVDLLIFQEGPGVLSTKEGVRAISVSVIVADQETSDSYLNP